MELTIVRLLLIITLIGLVSCALSDPDGWLNIKCGSLNNQTDKNGLLWISDLPFIKTRSVTTVRSPRVLVFEILTVAYFTNLEAKKYCYLLPVKAGINYLVRVNFNPEYVAPVALARLFDLIIEGTMWANVNLSNMDTTYYNYFEIILATNSNRLSLCLARNSHTEQNHFVFISSIELRPLNSSMYNYTDFQKHALYLTDRVNFGANAALQYPLDPFDRSWENYPASSMGDTSIVDIVAKDNQTKSLGSQLWNQPPVAVVSTAIAKNVVENMTISGVFPDFSDPGLYFFAFYFCYINQTNLTQKLVPFINDDNQMSDILTFEYLDCAQVHDLLELPTSDPIKINLQTKTGASDLGPFINAAEMYRQLDVQTTTLSQDVIAIRKIAEAMNVSDDWTGGDPCLPVNYSSTGIACSQDDPPRVIIVNLTNMHLEGAISPNIGDLTALTHLLLGNNSLSGHIPDLSSLKNLTILQLQNNQLTGEIPRSLEKLQMLSQLFLQGNKLEGTVSQGLMRSDLDLRIDPQNDLTSGSHKMKSLVIGLLVVCPVVLVLAFLSAIILWRRRRPTRPLSITDGSISSQQHPSAGVSPSADEDNKLDYHRLAVEYTEKDIKTATNNYSTVIGKGSFGSVFYGRISGYDVAVKVLDTDSNQGEREFQNEVAVLSRIYHKSLVNLMGYCRQSIMALVYEYMPCGTLKDHLYGLAKLETPLDWNTRLNIALQAAEALLYLHNGCSPPIVHRDIKCSNILLDNKMFAKLADFGLSKLVESSKGYTLTEVKGTMGYLDPEYFATLTLNEKSDVYSFGVVLLEIISGVSPKEGIVESAHKLISRGKIEDLVDSSLGGRYKIASAWKVAEIAHTCVQRESKNRPKMNVVVKELEEAVTLGSDDNNHSARVTMASFDDFDMPSVR